MLEVAVLVVLALVAVIQGYDVLAKWHGPASSLTNELYIPAASIAAGRGFVNIVPESVPGFRQFIDFQQPSMDTELLRSAGKEQPLHPYQEYHRYLVTAVGWVWSLFGVSWDSMKILIVLLFAVCLWEVYGISRLAMGVAASLIVALGFACTDTVTVALALLRDFSKAPFILGAILLLGWVIRRPRQGCWVIAFGAATGIVLGMGLGFRRDAMVVMPFAVMVFLLAPVAAGDRLRRLVVRMAAVAVLCGAFCAGGWPILKAFQEHGTLASHDTIMGFATNADKELSLQLASYEKLYLLNDLYCSMAAHDAGRRGLTVDSAEYWQHYTEADYDDVLKKKYVMSMALHFPADMISRGYGAVLRILGGIWGRDFNQDGSADGPRSIIRSLKTCLAWVNYAVPYGAWFALIALICVSAVNWRLATAMLAFVLFFGGYTSGQFSFRHAFHLEFAPLFFGAFLADRTVRLVVRGVRGCFGPAVGKAPSFRNFGKMAAQAAAWSLCMFALLWVPLQAAALVQRAQVDRMADKIKTAEKEPVGYRESRWDDRVLLTPEVADGCVGCQNKGLLVDYQTTVYAAVFAPGPDTPDVELCYEADDFSHPATIVLGPGAPCEVLYCFPAFESTLCNWWIRFAGLAVPKEQVSRFKGFYRIRHPEALELLVNMAIPADPARMLYRQHAVWPWSGSALPSFTVEGNREKAQRMQAHAREYAVEGKWSDALAGWEALAEHRPFLRRTELGRVEALDHLERPAEALDLLTALLGGHSGEGLACRLVDEYLSRSRSPEERTAVWHTLAGRLPEDPCVRRYADGAVAPPPSPTR